MWSALQPEPQWWGWRAACQRSFAGLQPLRFLCRRDDLFVERTLSLPRRDSSRRLSRTTRSAPASVGQVGNLQGVGNPLLAASQRVRNTD